MTPENVVDLISQAMWLIIIIVSVIIVPSLIVGLIIAIIQAATQINEQTLSFLPRLIVTFLMIIFCGHWFFEKLMSFFNQLFMTIPGRIG